MWGLIVAGVSKNTLKEYRRALAEFVSWVQDAGNAFRLNSDGTTGQKLPSFEASAESSEINDSVVALYITHLHDNGKSPSTIAQAVAAIKWQAKNSGRSDVVGAWTARTLQGIRREGSERGRGQVSGITWQDMERVCAHADASKTLAGLRDSALIRLMSDCLLRISEAVAVNVQDIDKVLTVQLQ